MNATDQPNTAIPYKTTVATIRDLNWSQLNSEELKLVMYLSWGAGALRNALPAHGALRYAAVHEGPGRAAGRCAGA